MKIAAIVAEYNPFHNGHAYHIEETRKLTGAEGIVAVMSGNFVQRGEIAVTDKFLRARAAVLGGCDLVIELPVVYALSAAQRFAAGAVSLLDSLGAVDFLSFGSECENIEELKGIADSLSIKEFKSAVKAKFDEGISYPMARSLAAREILGNSAADILSGPNNILAIEYLLALKALGSKIAPLLVKRYGAEHHSLEISGGFASGAAIRAVLEIPGADISRFVPKPCAKLYSEAKSRGAFNPGIKAFDTLVLSRIIRMEKEEIAQVPDVAEGLENRIYDAVRRCQGLGELYDAVKSKRFTHSRIRRIIMCAYLGITKEDVSAPIEYIRILALNKTGSRIIRQAKKSASLPMITKTSHIRRKAPGSAKSFELEALATRLYAFGFDNQEYRRSLNDYTTGAAVIGVI